ncbi:acyl-coenzyme A oxidase 3, peroxisomal-like [Vigna radiata var. radiata]|uniref:Acyl-coenzyme A oxidase 3, peroxisomal-like n=1 Tax=Vigna radiata var. radiata TaxID=3916 RepID=A0A3Q0ENI7_VIGRR|nr:acyl-coenzyme A oxidase 3, peroxisomal-like [Vigna radiata var. radiata]
MDHQVSRRTEIFTNHLLFRAPPPSSVVQPHRCLSYSRPELSNEFAFDLREMRRLMDGHNLEDRDWLFSVIVQSALFNRRERAGRIFVCPDYNQSMEQQREATMRRIEYLVERGVFRRWLTGEGPAEELRKLALHEVIGIVFINSEKFRFVVLYTLFINLLNSVADVSPTGEYLSAIKNVDQRFAAFLAPLTSGRVIIATTAVYISKISLAIAIRYALTRRAFSITPNGPEVLLLDYPSHQRRLLPLLAKVYAMSFSANGLKMMYEKRTPKSNKAIHIISSAYKATFTWNNIRTLLECREACGGQGVKSENRVGLFIGEFEMHFEALC